MRHSTRWIAATCVAAAAIAVAIATLLPRGLEADTRRVANGLVRADFSSLYDHAFEAEIDALDLDRDRARNFWEWIVAPRLERMGEMTPAMTPATASQLNAVALVADDPNDGTIAVLVSGTDDGGRLLFVWEMLTLAWRCQFFIDNGYLPATDAERRQAYVAGYEADLDKIQQLGLEQIAVLDGNGDAHVVPLSNYYARWRG